MNVIGTAGHVDHGKSSLVKALTGVDPDRLAEEKRRGMTIELGFAEWRLRSGRRIGIVDVPGHQRLVRTMVAGAHAIDLVLLVVAADSGVMPQTREHLDICELLGVQHAVVALTKLDLVDEETASIAAAEVTELLASTPLRDARIVATSTVTGAGLRELEAAVDVVLAQLPARVDIGCPRLFVDRAFSVAGFGPVVTGTLEGGSLRTGADVTLLPDDLRARVRGLERFGEHVDSAPSGGRTAVNLAGVERERLRRGMAVTLPGGLRCTRRLDVELRCMPASPVPIHHGAELRMHLGTTETTARVWLLSGKQVDPGHTGFAQLSLGTALPSAPRDRLVLRRPSPAATVGGGVVLDVAPRRRRRGDSAAATALAVRRDASPPQLVALALDDQRLGAEVPALARLAGLGNAPTEQALRAMGEAALHIGRRWITARRWRELADASSALLRAYHQADPLSPGMPREEWRTRMRLPASLGAEIAHRLAAERHLEERGAAVAIPGLAARVDPASRATAESVAQLLAARGLDAPSTAELRGAGMTTGILRLLVDEGRAIRLSADLVISTGTYATARGRIKEHLSVHGPATVAALRDAVGATRRVVVPLLERLDAEGVTLREGDVRRLRAKSGVGG
jgi:selenocysteine-specific elongation factor